MRTLRNQAVSWSWAVWSTATLCVFTAGGCGDTSDSPDGGLVGLDATVSCVGNEDCDDGLYCTGERTCDPSAVGADGRGCVAASGSVCLAGQRCDEAEQRCINETCETYDLDGDGAGAIECGGNDCDDADPNRYPGNPEVCDIDDHDEDCDPTTFGLRDSDRDNYPDSRCCNVEGEIRHCGSDCDDSIAIVHPGEAESCDGLDNDCDGHTDDTVLLTWYVDADGDGHGSDDDDAPTLRACNRPMGYAATHDDCNDDESGINPGLAEVCDAAHLDEDCDGVSNPATLCSCSAGDPPQRCMEQGVCAGGTITCIEGAWSACSITPVAERCNGLDDDCDGTDDDGVTVVCYADDDNDGYSASSAATSEECPDPSRPSVGGCPIGTTFRAPVADDIDCVDDDPSIRPEAFEVCDTIDNDCDGDTDEGVSIRCYADMDEDRYPPLGAPQLMRCSDPDRGFVGGCPTNTTNRRPLAGADCNDRDPAINPGATEICDRARVDENCDGAANPPADCDCANGDERPCDRPGVCGGGIETCRGGNWGACSVLPIGELCNGLDDDCDDSDDETFACVFGTVDQPCTVPTCGTAGTQDCRSDCSWAACRAPTETCNGCDDTGDGEVDEGFLCARNEASVDCTTPCGTMGTGTCNSSCNGVLDCRAATETCNYCDDDGDGTTQDEMALATTDRTSVAQCATLDLYDGATCAPSGSVTQEEVHLVSGTVFSDRGAAWLSTSEGVGWGTMVFTVDVRVQKGDSPPADGWALVLADGGTGFVGGVGGALAVPMTRTGLAIEWRYYDGNPNVEQADYVTVRRLTGGGSGTILRRAMVPDTAMHLGSSSSGYIDQRLVIRYRPRNASNNGEVLDIITTNFTSGPPTPAAFIQLWGGADAPPGYLPVLDHELDSGSPLEVGVTAANGGRRADVLWKIGMGPVPGVGPRSPISWNDVCY